MEIFRRLILLKFLLVSFLISQATWGKDRLLAGETLSNDQFISSPNGQYKLIMQTDGSLVMYRSNGTIRYSMEKRGTHAVMQEDGNFVEYRGTQALWSTGTWNCCEGYKISLIISDDGNLVVVKSYETSSSGFAMAVWEIGPDPQSPPTTSAYTLDTLSPPGSPPAVPPTKNPRYEYEYLGGRLNPRY